ncbi:MAG: FG-GAP repeat protein, partial [Planctomycetaceae bacterium]|nr:FG-GAP repeat protein [Planctomycetaceae bacterium]
GGFDLASLNIQRGRDHGLPSYNDVRDALGLGRVSDFSQITSDPQVEAKLRSICDDVDGLDLWVGGLAEDHLPGSSMGQTFTTILVDQFTRLRGGDRFWYQDLFNAQDIATLETTTLASVIERNTGIRHLQENVFFAPTNHDHSSLEYDITVMAPGAGTTGMVQVLHSTTMQEYLPSINAFPGFGGPIRVATGDVNNDGIPDVITGAGPGGGPHIKVFDGKDGQPIGSFFAFDARFSGGVHIAAADISGPYGIPDGFVDIVVSADAGGGPHVKVFSGQSVLESSQPTELFSFFAYNAIFSGGVRVATGDISGDGIPDIITSPGTGGGPHVKVFDGSNPQIGTAIPGALGGFMAYDPTFTGGVFVASGDIDGDGQIDLVTAAGQAGGPHVKVFGGAQQKVIAEFFAYDPLFTGGVHVSTSDTNGDGRADVITTPGQGGGPHVKVFDVDTSGVAPQMTELYSFMAVDPQYSGGLWCAGSTRQTSIAPMPLKLAAGFTPDGPTPNLTSADIQPTVDAAIERLENVGLPEDLREILSSVVFEITDLGGNHLAEALPGRIRIDINAAGIGWYIDPTPRDDLEFTVNNGNAVHPDAIGRIDLLTVILHEFVHELGGQDLNALDHPDHLMAETLPPSQRRSPQLGDLDDLFTDPDRLGAILE